MEPFSQPLPHTELLGTTDPGPWLRDPTSWPPLATEAVSRNLEPILLRISVDLRQSQTRNTSGMDELL